MKEYNLKDLYRYEGDRCHKVWVQLRYLLFTPAFQYSYCFRHAQHAGNFISRTFWHFLMRRVMFRSGIQIPIKTQIGEGFHIGHFGSIVVNPEAKIGKNFNISPGCNIGFSYGKQEGVPTIGDNVIMQTNSFIVGGVHVGNNVMLAPGAFVNFDVPDNSIVLGNPGKIIPRDYSPTEKWIMYSVDNY